MGRPKKGEAGDKEATRKWRATMEAKYGGPAGLRAKLMEMGAKGGRLSTTGGFYADRKLAREAGAKGGSVSRRGRTYLGITDGNMVWKNLKTGEIESIPIKEYKKKCMAQREERLRRSGGGDI